MMADYPTTAKLRATTRAIPASLFGVCFVGQVKPCGADAR